MPDTLTTIAELEGGLAVRHAGDVRPGGTRLLAARRQAGFVRVADDKTLMLPDRRGNNRIDSQPTTANGRACSEDDVVIAGSAPFHHLTLRRPRSGRLEG